MENIEATRERESNGIKAVLQHRQTLRYCSVVLSAFWERFEASPLSPYLSSYAALSFSLPLLLSTIALSPTRPRTQVRTRATPSFPAMYSAYSFTLASLPLPRWPILISSISVSPLSIPRLLCFSHPLLAHKSTAANRVSLDLPVSASLAITLAPTLAFPPFPLSVSSLYPSLSSCTACSISVSAKLSRHWLSHIASAQATMSRPL